MKTAGAAYEPSRREVFSVLFAAAAVTPVSMPEPDLCGTVDRDAATLAASMQALHGGVWRARVNHEQRVVVVMSEI